MRIIGGTYRGRALASVGKGDVAGHLRPTTDRIRESLFNVLTGGRYSAPLAGARVLDLFAGTGALGLEALSRGAAHVSFVENGRAAQALIRENIGLCRAADDCRLIARDVRRLGTVQGAPFDLIFLDPPYGKSLGEVALQQAIEGGWLADEALILWEDNAAVTPPPGCHLHETRAFGMTQISFLTYAPEETGSAR